MKKLTMTLAIAAALAVTPVFASGTDTQEQADNADRNSLIGLGSGALVGAALGGPIGAGIAGIFGLLIADDVNDENALDSANQQLALQQSELVQQEQELIALQDELTTAEQQEQMQLVSVDKAIERVTMDSEASIQFRTGSADIETVYQSQLDLIAENLAKNPQSSVNLSGFADRRGEEEANLKLSTKRVENVKRYLVERGAEAKQVATFAFGEAQPVNELGGVENDFFDRRVEIRLNGNKPVLTAAK